MPPEHDIDARVRAGSPGPDDPALRELRRGLSDSPREVSPKYFYDERGSRLFEEITRLPEYYLTRTEQSLLDTAAVAWIRELAPASMVELGAGSAEKTRALLDAMLAVRTEPLYLPVDVSGVFLVETAERLRAAYPGLRVEPIIGDIGRTVRLPEPLPRPALIAFLGSTIGNFPDDVATAMLQRFRALMKADDRFLLGADLKKDARVLEAAYNDAAGVTAAFNLNMLRVLNRRFGTDFDESAFEHRAVYDAAAGQVEMHLVALRDQAIRVPGGEPIRLAAGETIRTEISTKYDRPRLERLFAAAGLRLERWATDAEARFAVLLGAPAEPR